MTKQTSNPTPSAPPTRTTVPVAPAAPAAPPAGRLTRWRLGAAVLPLVLAGAAAAQDSHYFDGAQRRAVTLQPDLVAQFTPRSDHASALAAGTAALAGDSLMRIVRRPSVVSRTTTSSDDSPVYREGNSPAGRLMALPGGVLLKFQPDWTRERIDSWLAAQGLAVTRPLAQGDHWFFVATPPGRAALDTANRLHETGELLVALPNWWRQTQTR